MQYLLEKIRRSPLTHLSPVALLLAALVIAMPALGAVDREGEESITDVQIEVAYEGQLLSHPDIDSNWVDVSVTDGIVTLTGEVDNLLAKERATEIAESLKGVRSVINRLDIEPTARTDADIRSEVEEALLLDSATDSYEIGVMVVDGVVTLTGEVESWAEKSLARDVAMSVRGVRGVENEIALHFETDRPDAEIEAEILGRIKADVWVDHYGIEVDVDDGRVTLDGFVGSAAEKRRAYNDAWVAGVREVDDESLVVDWFRHDELEREQTLATMSDAEIRQAVLDAFVYDPRVFSVAPEVDVNNGIVTLTGEVENLQAKRAAEQDARNTRGVWRVRNLLKVRPDVLVSDVELEQRIEDAFERNVLTDSTELDATVIDGRAYLYGTVSSDFEREIAEDTASRTSGVTGVVNRIAVEDYEARLSDWEIRQDIESELWWSPFVDADQVNVTVEDGVATLTGEVDSWAERQSAMENAFEGGATSVINKLDVRDDMSARSTFGYYPFYYPSPLSP